MLILNAAPEKTKTGTVATIDEIKTQLNIPVEFTDDEGIISHLLAVAIETVEDDTKSDIHDVHNTLTHDLGRPGKAVAVPPLIYIYQAPAREVLKIEIENAGTWAELAEVNYKVEILFNRFEIRMYESPAAEKIRFTFTTGYEGANCPRQLKQAVILKAADLYGPERSNYAVNAISDNKTYLRLINKHIRTYW